jgi:hypothetical protein
MTLHVLVEGPSELVFFERWGPRLLSGHPIRIHPHQGKGRLPGNLAERPAPKARGLLDQLPAKLRAFGAALDPSSDAVVVVVDADEDDAVDLRDKILDAARSCAPSLPFEASVATEETEAFYLGDLKALERAFPEADMKAARAFVPDSVGRTWERFGEIIRDGGGNKVAWAEAMGPVVTTQPARSRSPSFKTLIARLLSLVPTPAKPKRTKAYRHPAKNRRSPTGRR